MPLSIIEKRRKRGNVKDMKCTGMQEYIIRLGTEIEKEECLSVDMITSDYLDHMGDFVEVCALGSYQPQIQQCRQKQLVCLKSTLIE
jgi:hypothetical protein